MAEESAQAGNTDALSDAKMALEAILTLKGQAEAAVQAAEAARQKADSESGFAFNAKQNAEEHAKAVAQVHGTVEAELTWLATMRKNTDDATQAIAAARQVAEISANTATELKAASETEVTAVKTLRQQAESALSLSEKSKNDSAAAAKRASDDAAIITQARATVETAASTVQALQTQVSDAAAKAQVDTSAIASRNTDSQTMLTSMAEVTETAKNAESIVSEHEKQLAQLRAQCAELHSKIEGLLPGATSAGLASAFRDQKARFTMPQLAWLTTFIVSLVGLFAAGSIELPNLVQEKLTWDSILLHLANRLPLAVPLVWLAVYAGRNYMLALRLQEEYAFKEALSTSFEGYKREMTGIAATDNQVLPILTLCNNVLETLALRPGRLYEGKHEDITPLSPFTKLLGDATRGRREQNFVNALASAILAQIFGNGGRGRDHQAAGDAPTKT